MIRFLQERLWLFVALTTLFSVHTAWAQTSYTLNHGFGGPTGLPTGIEIVSYSGQTSCVTTSNGGNAVTTLILRAAPGYNFTIESITGTGVRSNSGPTQFNFQVINNGTANGAASTVSGSSSCNGGTQISELLVPEQNQLVTSGNIVTINIPRSPGSTSGLGYSHVKTLVINGEVFIQAPLATAATALTTAGFTANWNAVTGATGYRLDVSSDADFNNILEDYDNLAVSGLSQYVSSGILPNTSYYYRVRAEIGELISGHSNIITVDVPSCGVVPLPTAAAQLFCGGGTVSGLMATGDTNAVIKWYEDQTGTTALTADTVIATTATYYVSQTVGGCESERLAVEVTVNQLPPAPETVVEQLFCGIGTVGELTALTGENLTWYEQVGGEPLSPDTMLINGNYFVTQTINGCESLTASTEASILQIPGAPVAEAQQFCGTATVADLIVTTGEAPKWYTTDTDGEALAVDAVLATGTYYVSQTVSVCESPRAAVEITVNEIPQAPVAEDQLFCGPATIASLMVTGEAPKWYTALTGGNALPADVPLGSATYYVSQTINGCESARTAVAVTISTTPAAPTAAAQAICGEGTVADLSVLTGTNPLWYTEATGGEALTPDVVVTDGIYFVSQTVNGCESMLRTPVEVTINTIPVAPTIVVSEFCGAATVAQLIVPEGVNALWYDAAQGGTPLSNTTALTSGNYYVSQIVNGCESPRIAVAVTVNALPAAPVNNAGVQTFCNNATVAELDVDGENIHWYSTPVGGDILTEDTILLPGIAIYYASQTVNGCESPRTAVAIQFNSTAAPVALAQAFCGTGTVSGLTVTTGIAPLWYTEQTGGQALTQDTALETRTYYVSQTISGCESARTAVEVSINVTPAPEGEQTQMFNAGDTLAALAVTGDGIVWYENSELTEVLDASTALVDGTTYFAVANIGECASEALAVTVDEILGNTQFTKTAFTAYPNPVTDVVTVKGNKTITGVTVHNLLGQPVISKNSNADSVTVNMANLTGGTYFIRVEFSNNFETIKVIKN
ncbi:T9SS type A sorting domain-containing protein [Flavobacterium sp. Sd200]|uniref:Ig-like domain-containing protein n=1 Tax=Flavobacterium sp. Sd200 TaxID=2692211 RepID=UPI00136D48E4|nr:T9SS type A sorting domain-containing protein [Flavobacterium sp. Sd200]MXN89829.1 T9SS type A sorting domain-containing protein [Flavobacterium sp. Sd200]